VPAAPPPPGATPPGVPPPGGPAGPTPPGSPGGRRPLHPAVLGAILGVGVLAVGLIVWFAFLRDDDGGGISAAPSASTSVGPDAVTASTTGATGPTTPPTGATGATGATAATGATGATAPAPSIFVELCESVDDSLNCVNGAPYDPATGWSVSQAYATVELKLTTENLQPGDVISINVVEQSSGEVFLDLAFDAAPAEVLDYEQWIYSAIPVTKGDASQPWDTESYEFTVSLNGEPLIFDNPNVFTFLP
jgi:hypothetical protein